MTEVRAGRSGADAGDLFARLAEGVDDTPVPQDRSSWVDEVQTGVRSTIGPWTVSAFADALRLLGETSEEVEEVWDVDPRFVLGYPWNISKLDAARQALVDGFEEHPILVTGHLLPGLPMLFSVADGMHRTSAMRLAGRASIRAEVRAVHTCAPDYIEIHEGRRIGVTRPQRRVFRDSSLSPETASILRALGVQDWEPSARRFLRRLLGR